MRANESNAMKILIADDEESIRFVLREALEGDGHQVEEATDGESASQFLSSGEFDLAFLDIRMPNRSGLEVLEQLQATRSNTAVVIITAQNTMDNAVEAMKRGALDYLLKPFSLAEVAALAERARNSRTLQHEVRSLRQEIAKTVAPGGGHLVGSSPELLSIFKMVGKVAVRNVPVLIRGESGTGKELVARAIHAASPRSEDPFIAVNAAAIPGELLESELFGHERGAFTGAISARLGRFREASGGTLFLDEIGDMPIELQAKLLRVVQNGEVTPVGGRNPVYVDVRIITATHRNLDQYVTEGLFREDLLYRLRVIPIEIPPLRDRSDDIRTLAEHFTRIYAIELGGREIELSESALHLLEEHDWPGNVRELENSIKRALVLATTRILSDEDFEFLEERESDGEKANQLEELLGVIVQSELDTEASTNLYGKLVERVEKPLISTVLAHTDGNQIRAAGVLGINRNTLRKKIVELGIPIPDRSRGE